MLGFDVLVHLLVSADEILEVFMGIASILFKNRDDGLPDGVQSFGVEVGTVGLVFVIDVEFKVTG